MKPLRQLFQFLLRSGVASRASSERGAILLQTAMVLPVLVVISGGVLDNGLMMSQEVTMQMSARMGARAGAALATDNCLAIKLAAIGAATTYLVRAGLDPENLKINADITFPLINDEDAMGEAYPAISVQITYPTRWFFLRTNSRPSTASSTFLIESELADAGNSCVGEPK